MAPHLIRLQTPNSAFAKLAFLWNFVFCSLSRTQKLISLSSGEAEMYASKLLPLQCTLFEKFTVFLNWSTSAPGPPVAFDMQLGIWRTKCTCPVVCCGWEIFWQITPYLQAQVHSGQRLGYQPSIHNKSGISKRQRFSNLSILEKHPFLFSQIPQKLEHIFMLTYHRFVIIVSLESWELGARGCIFLPIFQEEIHRLKPRNHATIFSARLCSLFPGTCSPVWEAIGRFRWIWFENNFLVRSITRQDS